MGLLSVIMFCATLILMKTQTNQAIVTKRANNNNDKGNERETCVFKFLKGWTKVASKLFIYFFWLKSIYTKLFDHACNVNSYLFKILTDSLKIQLKT